MRFGDLPKIATPKVRYGRKGRLSKMAIFKTSTTPTTTTTTVEVVASNKPSQLERLEAVIAAGLETVSDVGLALATIQNEKLYAGKYVTFAQYLADRWKMTTDYANKLMSAAVICDELAKLGLAKPTREAHTRELRKVPADKRPEVWTESLAAAGNDPANVTAELIAEKAAPHRRKTKARRKAPKTIVLKGKGWTVSIARKTVSVDPVTVLTEALAKLQSEHKAAA